MMANFGWIVPVLFLTLIHSSHEFSPLQSRAKVNNNVFPSTRSHHCLDVSADTATLTDDQVDDFLSAPLPSTWSIRRIFGSRKREGKETGTADANADSTITKQHRRFCSRRLRRFVTTALATVAWRFSTPTAIAARQQQQQQQQQHEKIVTKDHHRTLKTSFRRSHSRRVSNRSQDSAKNLQTLQTRPASTSSTSVRGTTSSDTNRGGISKLRQQEKKTAKTVLVVAAVGTGTAGTVIGRRVAGQTGHAIEPVVLDDDDKKSLHMGDDDDDDDDNDDDDDDVLGEEEQRRLQAQRVVKKVLENVKNAQREALVKEQLSDEAEAEAVDEKMAGNEPPETKETTSMIGSAIDEEMNKKSATLVTDKDTAPRKKKLFGSKKIAVSTPSPNDDDGDDGDRINREESPASVLKVTTHPESAKLDSSLSSSSSSSLKSAEDDTLTKETKQSPGKYDHLKDAKTLTDSLVGKGKVMLKRSSEEKQQVEAPLSSSLSSSSSLAASDAARKKEKTARSLLAARLQLDAKARSLRKAEDAEQELVQKKQAEFQAKEIAKKMEATSRGMLEVRLAIEAKQRLERAAEQQALEEAAALAEKRQEVKEAAAVRKEAKAQVLKKRLEMEAIFRSELEASQEWNVQKDDADTSIHREDRIVDEIEAKDLSERAARDQEEAKAVLAQAAAKAREIAQKAELTSRSLLERRFEMEARLRSMHAEEAEEVAQSVLDIQHVEEEARELARKAEATARGLLRTRLEIEAKIRDERAVAAEKALKADLEQSQAEARAMELAKKAEHTSRGLLRTRLEIEAKLRAQHISGAEKMAKEQVEAEATEEVRKARDIFLDIEAASQNDAKAREADAEEDKNEVLGMSALGQSNKDANEESFGGEDQSLKGVSSKSKPEKIDLDSMSTTKSSASTGKPSDESPLEMAPASSYDPVAIEEPETMTEATDVASKVTDLAKEPAPETSAPGQPRVTTKITESTTATIPRSAVLVPINKATVEFTSGLLGGSLGLAIGGPVLAAVAAAAANYVSRTEAGEAAVVVKTASTTAIDFYNNLANLTEKYQLLEKTQHSLEVVYEKVKRNDNVDPVIVKKVEDALAQTTSRIEKLNEKYDVLHAGILALETVGNIIESSVNKAGDVNKEYKLTDRAMSSMKAALEKAQLALERLDITGRFLLQN